MQTHLQSQTTSTKWILSIHSHETQFQVHFLICVYTVFKGKKIVSGAIRWNLAMRGTASLFIWLRVRRVRL